uniref:Uncharacterized protein n=1 Tax=Nelumbo nucifera TaxID=4432 RepID=A0A822YLY5_NELNU|nr:TPA_asm: hypothetical protein HUJ06_010866 [Nelumbo nucifera]
MGVFVNCYTRGRGEEEAGWEGGV